MLPHAAQFGLYSIEYEHTTLPQYVMKLSKPGNRKALVYMQGHAPPHERSLFAPTLLNTLLDEGYNILLPSIPLFGINIPLLGRPYFIRTADAPAPVEIASSVYRTQPHVVMEMIDDPDSYLHYFVDGALLPVTSNVAIQSASGRAASVGQADQAYEEVNFLGMSGGAMSGLVACAVQSFARCILVAGFISNEFRLANYPNVGDTEQVSRSYWRDFSVERLMSLARERNPRLTMFYNREDPCCFLDSWATAFQQRYSDYDIRVTDLREHAFDPATILKELER